MQCGHAIIEYYRSSNVEANHNTTEHPHLIYLEVKNEETLRQFCSKLDEEGIFYSAFHEPDKNNELTAICCEPVSGIRRKIFKKLQLFKVHSNDVVAVEV